MSIGAMPWSSIDRYGERHGIAGDEFDRFARLMREMDTAFLGWHRRRDEAQRTKP
jgi:hypothetical protein